MVGSRRGARGGPPAPAEDSSGAHNSPAENGSCSMSGSYVFGDVSEKQVGDEGMDNEVSSWAVSSPNSDIVQNVPQCSGATDDFYPTEDSRTTLSPNQPDSSTRATTSTLLYGDIENKVFPDNINSFEQAVSDGVEDKPIKESPLSSTSKNGLDDSRGPTTKTFERVLSGTSRPRGIRLKWLLRNVMLVIILVFLLIFWQFQWEAWHTSDVSLAQLSISTTTNRLEFFQQSIKYMLPFLELASSPRMHVIHNHLCSSLDGALVGYAVYGRDNSSLLWSSICSATHSHVSPPQILPTDSVEPDTFSIAGYHSDYIIAWGMVKHNDGEVPTEAGYFSIVLHKEPVRQLLLTSANSFSNLFVQKQTSVALFLPDFESKEIALALSSLGEGHRYYSAMQPGKGGQLLHSAFDYVCNGGKTHTGHTVLWSGRNVSTKEDNGINKASGARVEPFVEYKDEWGCLSRVVACGAVCFHQSAAICTEDNPSSIRFIVDYSPPLNDFNGIVTIVLNVGLVIIVLFVFVTLVAYFSIIVPIQHLKFLGCFAIGDRGSPTLMEKLPWRYIQYLWIDELVDLVKIFQTLYLWLQLYVKYVPQHVLDKQMHELQSDEHHFWNTVVGGRVTVAGKEDEVDDYATSRDQEDVKTVEDTVSRERKKGSLESEFMSKEIAEGRSRSKYFGLLHQAMAKVSKGNALVNVAHGIGEFDRGMSLVDTATILTVHLSAVERTFFSNCKAGVEKHRRIMNLLLGRIRYYRGEPFVRSGDCIAASWNAFESRADHAQRAAACARSIAKSLKGYREAGFRVGIMLHQGSFVCGVFQDDKEAFPTVFGSVPRQAVALAELAASLPWFSLLVTEPVKQSLSSLYECIMVDVIKYNEDETPIKLFELIGELRSPNTPGGQKGTPLVSPTFASEYARVFFEFRNHKFTSTLDGIQKLRVRFPTTASQILARLELLCRYYTTRAVELPLPYIRPYPTWVDYEAIASAGTSTADHRLHCSLDDPHFLTHLPRQGAGNKSLCEDDTNGFVRELHDEIIASRRTGNDLSASGTPVTAVPRTSSLFKLTPRVDENTEKQASTSIPLEKFVLPPAVTVLQAPPNENVDPSERSFTLNPHDKPNTHEYRDVSPPCFAEDGFEKTRRGCDSSLHSNNNNNNNNNSSSGSSNNNGCDLASDDPNAFAGEGSGSINRRISIDSKGHESVLSLSSPRNPPDAGDIQDRTECLRFSFTNCLSEAIIERGGHNIRPLVDSFVSVESSGFPHAASMSIRDPEGSSNEMVYGLPREIIAKNGITYLRSLRNLGNGSFGCVYLGMDVHSNRLVAIKFLPLPSDEEKVSNIETEVVTMQKVKSNHVVEFISYAFQNNLVILVMECMMAGSLKGMLTAFNIIPFSSARLFMRDVLRGLHKLHSTGIIHRDVKPQNVLLTLSGCCKISDFGASAFLQELVRKQMEGKGLQVQGTPLYLSPEAARGVPEASSDIWSCGIMFIQLVTGGMAYANEFLNMPPEVLVFQIGSGAAKPIIPDNIHEFDEQFLCHCLQDNPNDRLSAQLLLELPIFAL